MPTIPLYQTPEEIQAFLKAQQHPLISAAEPDETAQRVQAILVRVAQEGDAALYALAEQFGDSLKGGMPIRVPDAEIEAAAARVSEETREYLDEAITNIRAFGQLMMEALPSTAQPVEHRHSSGYQCGFRLRPVQRVACYVPAGRYPLVSSAMMTTLTAEAAGVPERYLLCANPADEILYVAQQAGVRGVFRIGGAQALAAVAMGTVQIPKTDMVVGPGNRYVNEAKRQLIGRIGIDMLAGPSEVLIVAGADADPAFLASDLIAQAEHDPDARCILLTPSPAVAAAIEAELAPILNALELPEFVTTHSLAQSAIVVLPTLERCIAMSNALSPEHLHLHGQEVVAKQNGFTEYGSLFVGEYATVAHGDYCAGPNHTLPTQGTARFSSSLSPLAFLRVQNTLTVSEPNLYLNDVTAHLANLEQLSAHAYSALLRCDETAGLTEEGV
jgi:histidinol dehydrogenase